MTQPPDFLLKWAEERKAFWENPPRGTCPECSRADEIMHEQPKGAALCADCSRRSSFARARGFTYPCDDCGGPSAFRDPLPRTDIYRCRACHEKAGYIPGERAMITRIEQRSSPTHSKGRRDTCSAADLGTACQGEVKPRGKLGVLCAKHHAPRLFR